MPKEMDVIKAAKSRLSPLARVEGHNLDSLVFIPGTHHVSEERLQHPPDGHRGLFLLPGK